jgi:hypothetical protein
MDRTLSSSPGRSGSRSCGASSEAVSASALSYRSGQAARPKRVELVAADASDGSTLARALAGGTILYHCASTRYHTWPTTLPPIMAAVVAAAAATGARIDLATPGSTRPH